MGSCLNSIIVSGFKFRLTKKIYLYDIMAKKPIRITSLNVKLNFSGHDGRIFRLSF